MKTVFTICVIVLNLVSNQFFAQINLVNNPSFENLTTANTCPNAFTQLDKCAGWVSTYASPDYFNICGTSIVSVPKSAIGYQDAASGQAYAGFVALTSFSTSTYYREFLGTHLTQALVPGTRYYLSMKFNIAEYWQDVNDGYEWKEAVNTVQTNTLYSTYLPCNKIGMKFYTKSHVLSSPGNTYYSLINNVAHLYAQNIISDTTNWTTIQGSFIADSAYTHLIIGNFFTNANTDTIARKYSNQSYYFVDDIIVSTDSNILTGLNENSTKNNIAKLYSNPVADKLSLEFLNTGTDDLKFVITNTLGQMVLNSRIKIQNHKAEIDLAFLQSGIYYLKVESGKEAGTFKIIKQ